MKNGAIMSLKTPSNYIDMNNDLMESIEGGQPKSLDNSRAYLSRSTCLNTAKTLKAQGFCTNMSQLEVAKEIHGHAVILYMGVPAAIAAAAVGQPAVAAALLAIANHGVDGIYLDDNLDSAARVMGYNAVWPLGTD